MIHQVQSAILEEDGGYAQALPWNFLNAELIVDNEVPHWNRLYIFDPNAPEYMMIFVNSAYGPEPPMTDERVAAAQEALQQL
jgi:hypothetical protein